MTKTVVGKHLKKPSMQMEQSARINGLYDFTGWNRFHPQLHRQTLIRQRKWSVIQNREQSEIIGHVQEEDDSDQASLIRCRDDEMFLVAQVWISGLVVMRNQTGMK
jgi:hypothetical protein